MLGMYLFSHRLTQTVKLFFVKGICNAPGTAKALAELVLEGEIKCANLEAMDPKHFL